MYGLVHGRDEKSKWKFDYMYCIYITITNKAIFIIQRAYVTMDSHREERISQLLGEMRGNEHSRNNDRAQAGASSAPGASGASGAPGASGASACRDWYDAPYEDNEQREGGSYLYNRDQPEAGSYSRDTGMFVHWLVRGILIPCLVFVSNIYSALLLSTDRLLHKMSVSFFGITIMC